MAIDNNTLTIRTFLFFLPHERRVVASSFSTGPPRDHGALHCHWTAIATNRSDNAFRFKRAAFYMGLKSKVGLVAAKASALWINLNLSPSFYFLFLQEQKKGIIIISARWAD